ncbi:hypothetical protein I4U23_016524 [Adineta vaga]|nr:hypothetical protein I4U23_016524 [Adineta vaga]
MVKETSITVPNTSLFSSDDTELENERDYFISKKLQTATITDCDYSPLQAKIDFPHKFRLIWLHSIDSQVNPNPFFLFTVDTFDNFTNSNECIAFITTNKDDIFFLITSNELVQSLISHIHHLSQMHSILIFPSTISKNTQWIKTWSKIKGFFTDISSIIQTLRKEIQEYRHNSFIIGITSKNLYHIDSWFVCTQLLKELLIETNLKNKLDKKFLEFCQEKLRIKKSVLDDFQQTYYLHSPIWWFIQDYFLFHTINQAFQLHQINVLIEMKFFIQDLCQEIQKKSKLISETMTLYRGQRLSNEDFQYFYTIQGGLCSFNSFLVATIYEETAISYARKDPNLIGIVFQINIYLSKGNSIEIVSLENDDLQGEFLFMINTMFRIGQMKQIDDQLWQIQLELINNDDEDFKQINKFIEKQTQGSFGWDRISKLYFNMEYFDKAEEILQFLIDKTDKNHVTTLVDQYHLMGLIKTKKYEYKKAFLYYYKALKLITNSVHVNLSIIYNDLGLLYYQLEKYTEAILFYQMALDLQRESKNSLDLITIYYNMGQVYKDLNKYSDALQCYENILEIHQQSIPLNYSKLLNTHETIANIHIDMENYSEALKVFEKQLKIQKDYFPEYYISIALIQNNIIQIYDKTEQHSIALNYFDNALQYCQIEFQNLNKDNIHYFFYLTMIYNTIGEIYKSMKIFDEALNYFRKTLRIINRFLHVNKSTLATLYYNIGLMCEHIYQYENAFFAYGKAIKLIKKLSPPNSCKLRLYRSHWNKVSKKVALDSRMV